MLVRIGLEPALGLVVVEERMRMYDSDASSWQDQTDPLVDRESRLVHLLLSQVYHQYLER